MPRCLFLGQRRYDGALEGFLRGQSPIAAVIVAADQKCSGQTPKRPRRGERRGRQTSWGEVYSPEVGLWGSGEGQQSMSAARGEDCGRSMMIGGSRRHAKTAPAGGAPRPSTSWGGLLPGSGVGWGSGEQEMIQVCRPRIPLPETQSSWALKMAPGCVAAPEPTSPPKGESKNEWWSVVSECCPYCGVFVTMHRK